MSYFRRKVIKRFLDHHHTFKMKVNVAVVNEVFENLLDKRSVLKVLEAELLFWGPYQNDQKVCCVVDYIKTNFSWKNRHAFKYVCEHEVQIIFEQLVLACFDNRKVVEPDDALLNNV